MRVLLLLFALLPPAALAQPLDLLFVLDTTGSMGGEIKEAKERIREISLALRKAREGHRVRVGVVAYRDKGDDYVTRVFDLTEDTEATFGFLAGLTANGGGDMPEDVLAALEASLRKISWDPSPGTERQLFIIADAPPQLGYKDRLTTEQIIEEARSRRIVLHAIGCRSLGQGGIGWFRALAWAAEGSYQHIGRVSTDEGLAKAMLQTLAAPTPVDVGRLPEVRLSPVPSEGGSSAPAERVAVLPWTRGKGADARCGIQLQLPMGYDLGGPPRVRRGDDALHLDLSLVSGQGRNQRYAFDTCPSPTLPLRITFGELR